MTRRLRISGTVLALLMAPPWSHVLERPQGGTPAQHGSSQVDAFVNEGPVSILPAASSRKLVGPPEGVSPGATTGTPAALPWSARVRKPVVTDAETAAHAGIYQPVRAVLCQYLI